LVHVDQVERLIRKVVNHGPVIKVRRHPAQLGDSTMKVEHDIQRPEQFRKGKSPEPLKGRGRVRSPGAFNADEFSRGPLINQHRPVRRLDYVKQLWEAVMIDVSAKVGGVSK